MRLSPAYSCEVQGCQCTAPSLHWFSGQLRSPSEEFRSLLQVLRRVFSQGSCRGTHDRVRRFVDVEGGISLVSCLRGRGAIRKLSYDALLYWKSVKHERRPRYAIPHLLGTSDLRSNHFAGDDYFDSSVLLPALGRAVVGYRVGHPKTLRR
jgi:hypothetical protein